MWPFFVQVRLDWLRTRKRSRSSHLRITHWIPWHIRTTQFEHCNQIWLHSKIETSRWKSSSYPELTNTNQSERRHYTRLRPITQFRNYTPLPFNSNASPIFVQRKPNGELCPFVGLQKVSDLITDDYIYNNHAGSTWTDALEHIAGKIKFV